MHQNVTRLRSPTERATKAKKYGTVAHLKILYINTLFSPHVLGGAEITLKTLVTGMQQRGHDVVVLTTGPAPGLTEEVIDGIRVIRAGLKNIYWHYQDNRPKSWQRLLWHVRDVVNRDMAAIVEEVVRREKPDLVSVHNLPGWSVAAWAAIRRTKTPIVQVLHDLYLLCPNSNMFSNNKACERQCTRCKVFRLPHRQLSEAVDAVVGISQFVLDRHLQHDFFSNARIKRAIHNARAIQITSQLAAPHRDGPIKIGFIGTLTPAKGIELLLTTFERANLTNTELVIAGKGKSDYETTLRQRYERKNIRFLGYVSPEPFFQQIDLLVVPSIWPEALGMVIPEAFAHGIPVVASRRGGIPEMVKHGVNGYLFEPDNPDELETLLRRITMNPSLVASLSARAVESAPAFTNVNEWARRYEQVYRDVLTNQVAPSVLLAD